MSSCKKCNSSTCKTYQQTSGYRERPSYVFYQRAYRIASDAAKKGIVTEGSKALKMTLLHLWEHQEGRCFYTGKSMSLTGWPAPDAATVDRLVPARGYVRGNVVLCRSLVNRSKQDMVFRDFVLFCREILENEERVTQVLETLEQLTNFEN